MPRGSKESYTSKQKRQAHHIEESEKERGMSSKRAAQIGWATVNKETGGAGRAVSNTEPSKRGGRKGGLAKAAKSAKAKSASKRASSKTSSSKSTARKKSPSSKRRTTH
ncbi:plasmid stabilization protein [Bdellovibrio sp. NC01]|uniref:plasmid stabilization protein n=1 Tax=Bdellovibrio sp. NC01 TaxID=2220073 RepID=UPI00115B159F|nr:plasmid stabilization protein [Bdellovibrio sp. NC01]QDK37996.1 plasmid stabilization protein [Bdellovibrio sp. NC01]